jgi:hypothetical protein
MPEVLWTMLDMDNSHWLSEAVDETKNSKPSRDQGIFIRGFKICDKHTALARIVYRNWLKQCDDGFTHIPLSDKQVIPRSGRVGDRLGEDTDKDKDGQDKPPGSHQDPSSGPPDNSPTSSKDRNTTHFNPSGPSDRNTNPSDSLTMDFSALGLDIDEDLALYLQQNCDKVCMSITPR